MAGRSDLSLQNLLSSVVPLLRLPVEPRHDGPPGVRSPAGRAVLLHSSPPGLHLVCHHLLVRQAYAPLSVN
eukprot:scaffold316343_cov27-Prasinocladus_malaysianus.AAC.1